MEKKHFIRINGQLVEVTREVYYAYYSERRKWLTQREKEVRRRVVSYDAWDTGEAVGAASIQSCADSPEQQVTYKMMAEKLNACLGRLAEEERELIHVLFYCDVSLSEAARRLGIPRKTLQDKRDRLLRRLRTMMEAPLR